MGKCKAHTEYNQIEFATLSEKFTYVVWQVRSRREKHEENVVRDHWDVNHGQTFIVVYLALTLLKLDAYTRMSLFHWEMAVRAMKSTASYLFPLSSKLTLILTAYLLLFSLYWGCMAIPSDIIIVTWYVQMHTEQQTNNSRTSLPYACTYPAGKWFIKYYMPVWPSALYTWICHWLEFLQA